MNNFSDNTQTTASVRPLADQLDWEKCKCAMIPRPECRSDNRGADTRA